MQFGKVSTSKIVSSVETEEVNFVAGKIANPIRKHYEIIHRTNKTDIETLALLAKSLLDDPTRLDIHFKLERTATGEKNGYYHIIECYTTLEY